MAQPIHSALTHWCSASQTCARASQRPLAVPARRADEQERRHTAGDASARSKNSRTAADTSQPINIHFLIRTRPTFNFFGLHHWSPYRGLNNYQVSIISVSNLYLIIWGFHIFEKWYKWIVSLIFYDFIHIFALRKVISQNYVLETMQMYKTSSRTSYEC